MPTTTPPESIARYIAAANAQDAESVAAAMRWFQNHAEERTAMGAAGRRRVATSWNYETSFAPVERTILGRDAMRTAMSGQPTSQELRR